MIDITVRALPVGIEVVLNIIATIILFFILRHFLFGPVTEFLNKRKEGIANDLAEAKDNKEKAIELKNEYEVKIEEAKNEGKEIIEAAKKRGEDFRNKIIEDAKKEAQEIVEKGRKQIATEREKAVDDLKSEVVTIAMMAASKVVDENLDVNAHKKLISEFISEVGESKWQN